MKYEIRELSNKLYVVLTEQHKYVATAKLDEMRVELVDYPSSDNPKIKISENHYTTEYAIICKAVADYVIDRIKEINSPPRYHV